MMNKIKKISVFLLLLIMTACVIYLPQIMNEQNERNLLNKMSFWNYNGRSSKEITSRQVAELYRDSEIYNGYYSSLFSNEKNYNALKMQESSTALFEVTFKSNESICEYMKKMLAVGSPHYTQSSILTMIDDHPIVLNFINVLISNVDSTLEFTYEEKTETLISFSYFSLSHPLNYEYKDASFMNTLELIVKDYYENKLGLDSEEYLFYDEFEEEADLQNYVTGFGILMYKNEIDKKEYEIYSLDTE